MTLEDVLQKYGISNLEVRAHGPTNYWYAARENEVFLDLDSQRALTRALHVVRRVIQAESTHRWPGIKAVFLYKTQRPQHYHMIVIWKAPLPRLERYVWALWMGSDRLRCAYVIKRRLEGVTFPDILGAAYRYQEYEKFVGAVAMTCFCKGKHKSEKITWNCPALQLLLGGERSADYYPRNVDRKARRNVQFNYGRISKRSIVKWQGKKSSTTSRNSRKSLTGSQAKRRIR